MNTLKCSMLSASILALSTGWAAADPAMALDYLNLRTGPSVYFDIIAIVPAGWIVNTGECFDGWCQVNASGFIGYLAANYLAVPGSPYYGSTWTYPNYAYYGGYYGALYVGVPYVGAPYVNAPYVGAPYVGPYGNIYAQGRDADLKAARRPTDQVKRAEVAKNSGTAVPHVARLVGPSTTGAAPSTVRPNRMEQIPPR